MKHDKFQTSVQLCDVPRQMLFEFLHEYMIDERTSQYIGGAGDVNSSTKSRLGMSWGADTIS